MSSKSKLPIVQITGVGVFAPILEVGSEILNLGLVSMGLSAFYGFTLVYFIVRIVSNKRWDGAKKFGWIAGFIAPQFFFPPISWLIAVYFWWTEIREANKWATLAG